MDLRVARGKQHLEILNRIVPHPDIIGDGILEEDDILVNDREGAGHHASRNLLSGLPVKKDLPLPGVVQAGNQLGQGGFSAAGGSDESDAAAGLQGHGKIPDQRRRDL